jgi:hypothetical protein
MRAMANPVRVTLCISLALMLFAGLSAGSARVWAADKKQCFLLVARASDGRVVWSGPCKPSAELCKAALSDWRARETLSPPATKVNCELALP